MLVVAIFLLRLFGQGMMTHIAMTATGRWFALQRGRAIAYGYRTAWVAGALAVMLIGLGMALPVQIM